MADNNEAEVIDMLSREKRILIDDNDPLMAQFHLNKLLVSQLSDSLKSSLDASNLVQQEQLEGILEIINKDIEGTLNKALFFSKKTMDEEFTKRTNEMIAQLKKQSEAHTEQVSTFAMVIKKFTAINVIAASIVLISTCVHVFS